MLWTVIHEWKLLLWPLLLPLLLLFEFVISFCQWFFDFCLCFVLCFTFSFYRCAGVNSFTDSGCLTLRCPHRRLRRRQSRTGTTILWVCLFICPLLFSYISVLRLFVHLCFCCFCCVWRLKDSVRFGSTIRPAKCGWGLAASCGNTLKYYFATAAAFKGPSKCFAPRRAHVCACVCVCAYASKIYMCCLFCEFYLKIPSYWNAACRDQLIDWLVHQLLSRVTRFGWPLPGIGSLYQPHRGIEIHFTLKIYDDAQLLLWSPLVEHGDYWRGLVSVYGTPIIHCNGIVVGCAPHCWPDFNEWSSASGSQVWWPLCFPLHLMLWMKNLLKIICCLKHVPAKCFVYWNIYLSMATNAWWLFDGSCVVCKFGKYGKYMRANSFVYGLVASDKLLWNGFWICAKHFSFAYFQACVGVSATWKWCRYYCCVYVGVHCFRKLITRSTGKLSRWNFAIALNESNELLKEFENSQYNFRMYTWK